MTTHRERPSSTRHDFLAIPITVNSPRRHICRQQRSAALVEHFEDSSLMLSYAHPDP